MRFIEAESSVHFHFMGYDITGPAWSSPVIGGFSPLLMGVSLGVLVLLLLLLRRAIRGHKSTGRNCRWRKDARRHGVSNTRWICTSCTVDAYSQGGRPPKECKRALRRASL